MTFRAQAVQFTIRSLLGVLCKVDAAEMERIPHQGPLIIVVNHINFLDAPVGFTNMYPRPVVALVKKETFDNPLIGFLFDTWGGIPIRRGEADLAAFQKAREELARGKILVVAPEGTRSNIGKLLKAHPGVILLALKSGAPILPVGYYGSERFRDNISRLLRTEVHIRVGNPFRLVNPGQPSREALDTMIAEVMYQLAALLPPAYRGHYSDLHQATETHLQFDEGVESNLRRAGF